MATNKEDKMTSQISEYVQAGIKKEARKIADQHKEQIVKDVEDAMSDIVAKLSVRLAKFYRIEDMGAEIRITIQKDFPAPK